MPSDADATDSDLLARLNALRPSTVTLRQTPLASGATQDPEPDAGTGGAEPGDLAARFAKLGGGGGGGGGSSSGANNGERNSGESPLDFTAGLATDTPHNDEDDGTIEELLAELGSGDTWKLEAGEETRARDLVLEARKALGESAAQRSAADESGVSGEAAPLQGEDVTARDGEEQEQGKGLTEEQEADEIVQRLLAEVSLEDGAERLPEDGDEEGQQAAGNDDDVEERHSGEDDGTLVDLPAAPTALPTGELSSDDGPVLPSAPSTFPSQPGSTASASARSNLPTYTDEEIDTWCIICNDEATLRCLGCDDDLYCGNCWNEGHRGPDASFEDRIHKAVRFTKPDKELKKAAKSRKKLLHA